MLSSRPRLSNIPVGLLVTSACINILIKVVLELHHQSLMSTPADGGQMDNSQVVSK